MNCVNHPELEAAAFCRDCGKAMCAECERPARGSVYCADHLPAQAPRPAHPRPEGFTNSPYYMPDLPGVDLSQAQPFRRPSAGTPPALAFILGFIPGVGAICNGQYAKGLIHAVVFGLLVGSIACYFGYQTEGGAEAVGRSTTQSVVTSIIMIIIADAVMTGIFIYIL